MKGLIGDTRFHAPFWNLKGPYKWIRAIQLIFFSTLFNSAFEALYEECERFKLLAYYLTNKQEGNEMTYFSLPQTPPSFAEFFATEFFL